MSEKEPGKDKPKQISPYRGAIELMQVGSLLLIPAGWLLLPHRLWAAAAWYLAALLALLPFHLAAVRVRRAQKARAAAEAEKAERARVEAEEAAEAGALRRVVAKEVPPYHSSREGAEVYHIFSDCYLGNNIEEKYRKDGMGDKTLCERCEEMKREKERERAA